MKGPPFAINYVTSKRQKISSKNTIRNVAKKKDGKKYKKKKNIKSFRFKMVWKRKSYSNEVEMRWKVPYNNVNCFHIFLSIRFAFDSFVPSVVLNSIRFADFFHANAKKNERKWSLFGLKDLSREVFLLFNQILSKFYGKCKLDKKDGDERHSLSQQNITECRHFIYFSGFFHRVDRKYLFCWFEIKNTLN